MVCGSMHKFFLNIPLQQQAQIFIKLYLKSAVNAFRVSFPDVFLLGYNTSQNESHEKKVSNLKYLRNFAFNNYLPVFENQIQ